MEPIIIAILIMLFRVFVQLACGLVLTEALLTSNVLVCIIRGI